MTCWQPELPDEIILVEEGGKTAYLIIIEINNAIRFLQEKKMAVYVDRYRGTGKAPVKSKTSEETWINPDTWIVKGYQREDTETFVRFGIIKFLWSDHGPPYCVCCGDPEVPHPHNYAKQIIFDNGKDPLEEFMRLPNVEGKRIRIRIEIMGGN